MSEKLERGEIELEHQREGKVDVSLISDKREGWRMRKRISEMMLKTKVKEKVKLKFLKVWGAGYK